MAGAHRLLAFSISPQGFLAQMNRATAETAQQTAISEGLAPIQSWVKQLVDYLLITEFDVPDLEFCWRDEREIDPQQAASVDTGAALALAAVFLIASHRFAWADGWVLDFRQTFPETRNAATRHCSEETHRLCRGELLLLWNNRYQAASIIASVAPGNIYLKFRFRDRYLFQGSQPFVHISTGSRLLRDAAVSSDVMLSEPPPLTNEDSPPDALYHRPVTRLSEALAVVHVDIRPDF